MAVDPGQQLADEGRVVGADDAELGQRERLRVVAAVEAGEPLPVLVVGVDVGADPVDVFVARVEEPRAVLGDGRRARRQGAPDHRDRRLRQAADGAPQRRQAGFAEAGVDHAALAAAVDDHVDPPEGADVLARAVGGVARFAGAVVGGPDVEAAVRLPEGPEVGAHPLRPEQLVEPDQVLVAFAAGDRPGGDQLVAVALVRGRDVHHRPRPRVLPAFDRVREVGAPGAEGLDQRRVLVGQLAELAEVGGVAGVGDAEEDLLALRREVAGRRGGGGADGEERRQGSGHRRGFRAQGRPPLLFTSGEGHFRAQHRRRARVVPVGVELQPRDRPPRPLAGAR